MFTHIVFFKLKEATRENIEKVANILRAMEGKIPQLKEIEVGVDELHTERSYDVALITRFESLEDMDAYQIHPYHVNEVLAHLRPMLEYSKVVDYSS